MAVRAPSTARQDAQLRTPRMTDGDKATQPYLPTGTQLSPVAAACATPPPRNNTYSASPVPILRYDTATCDARDIIWRYVSEACMRLKPCTECAGSHINPNAPYRLKEPRLRLFHRHCCGQGLASWLQDGRGWRWRSSHPSHPAWLAIKEWPSSLATHAPDCVLPPNHV